MLFASARVSKSLALPRFRSVGEAKLPDFASGVGHNPFGHGTKSAASTSSSRVASFRADASSFVALSLFARSSCGAMRCRLCTRTFVGGVSDADSVVYNAGVIRNCHRSPSRSYGLGVFVQSRRWWTQGHIHEATA